MRKLSWILGAIGAIAASGLAIRKKMNSRKQEDSPQPDEAIPGQFTHPHANP